MSPEERVEKLFRHKSAGGMTVDQPPAWTEVLAEMRDAVRAAWEQGRREEKRRCLDAVKRVLEVEPASAFALMIDHLIRSEATTHGPG